MSSDAATPNQPRMASIADAATRIDVHPRTIRRAIAEGRITGYRIGRRAIRVDLNEVDALLEPIPAAALPPRRQGIEWRDDTGDTAARIVDFLRSCSAEERARISQHLTDGGQVGA